MVGVAKGGGGASGGDWELVMLFSLRLPNVFRLIKERETETERDAVS